MSRYIDADKLRALFDNNSKVSGAFYCAEWEGIDKPSDFQDLIDEQPTADVRENVRANLVIAGYKINGSTQWFECSVCGGSVDFADNFCKHCGAQIRGGNDD